MTLRLHRSAAWLALALCGLRPASCICVPPLAAPGPPLADGAPPPPEGSLAAARRQHPAAAAPPAPAPGAPLVATCAEGRLLPEVYILGAQKAATTSLGVSLVCGGVELACRPGACANQTQFLGESAHTGSQKECHLLLKNQPDKPGLRGRWLQDLPPCPSSPLDGRKRPIAGDFSPSYLRLTWPQLPAVPALLKGLHGGGAGRAKFIIVLRDPVRRMHSAYHQETCCADCHQDLLGMYTAGRGSSAEGYYSDGARRNLLCESPTFERAVEQALLLLREKDLVVDWLGASMYAEQLQLWLQAFDPRQFYILGFQHIVSRLPELCADFAGWLDFELMCARFSVPHHSNKSPHPRLEDEISPSTLADLNAALRPSMVTLENLLTQGRGAGMRLAFDEGLSVGQWLTSAL